VWFSAHPGDAVYEAMLPAGDPPLDDDGEPVVRPAVRRDVLEAIRRDMADMVVEPAARLEMALAGDALVVECGDDEYAFRPGPDGLYEVGPLAGIDEVWSGSKSTRRCRTAPSTLTRPSTSSSACSRAIRRWTSPSGA
jgi:hypothetical protein